mgnify:FL=1
MSGSAFFGPGKSNFFSRTEVMPRKHLNIGSKIQNRRKAMGLSQEELAQRTGVSRQAVTKWETGQSAPDLDRLVRLCDELGVSLDHLLRDNVDSPACSDDSAGMTETVHGAGCVQTETGRLLLIWGCLLAGAGIFGILLVMWVLAKIYPVQLTDWDGSRYTGLWGFILRYDLGALFWLSLGIVVVGCLLLLVRQYALHRSRRHGKNGIPESGRIR